MKPAGGWSAVIGTALALASLTYVIGYNIGSNSANTQLEAVQGQRDQLQQELESAEPTPEPTPTIAAADEQPAAEDSPTPDEDEEVVRASPSPRASSRGTSPTWLSDLEPVDYQNGFGTGAADVNAGSYANSLWAYMSSGAGETWSEYNLSRRYETLEAVVGLRDDSDAEGQAQFEVFIDGESRFVTRLAFGQSEELAIPVDGALRVRLVVTGLEATGQLWATWGNAAVLPS